jgi:hypothetical protein
MCSCRNVCRRQRRHLVGLVVRSLPWTRRRRYCVVTVIIQRQASNRACSLQDDRSHEEDSFLQVDSRLIQCVQNV